MTDNILEVRHLSHRYSKAWAIRNINFDIHQTGVLGLLGSNGAGKSTVMNIISGVLNQSEGNVLIAGTDLRRKPEEAKKLIGFLPQNPPLHMDLTLDEYLIHCAYLRLMNKTDIPGALKKVKERCGIAHFSKRLIRNLSGGYRQRVGIAQAIIHNPRLVVLDEPTNGLDPNQITEVRKLIRGIGAEHAVIFSSHILSEVQAACRDIKMIEGGNMVFEGSMDSFNNYIKPDSLMVFLDAPPALEELRKIPGIVSVELLGQSGFRMKFEGDAGITKKIVALSLERDWQLKEITLEKSSLDEVFAQLSSKTPSKVN
jgi:ABC-2 type transport system ATP-binding protein